MQPIQNLASDIQRVQDTMRRKLDQLPAILGEESVRMARTQIERQGTIDGGFRPLVKRQLVTERAFSTNLKRGKDGKYSAGKENFKPTDQQIID